jgi:NAD+ kinase
MTIRVKWLREGQTLAESVAVNDVVLVKQYEARMIRFILKQGPSELASFAADGLIVATPTGSTAYNLSAGGPIVYPELRTLVVTAVCPHTLSSRPMILPPDPPVVMQFVLRRRRDQAMLWIDGQEHWPIAEGDQVSVQADPWPLRLISNGAEHYFTILRDNLSWSGEPQRSDLSNKAAASCRTPNLF